MDFQNLQDKLIEKKLNLTEYFKESKEVVKVFLKEIPEEKMKIVNKITEIYLSWEKEMALKYPKLTDKGRPLYSKDDTPEFTSIETYLKGELLSYSLNTLNLYFEYIKECITKNINLVEINLQNIVKEKGYSSLADVENKV